MSTCGARDLWDMQEAVLAQAGAQARLCACMPAGIRLRDEALTKR